MTKFVCNKRQFGLSFAAYHKIAHQNILFAVVIVHAGQIHAHFIRLLTVVCVNVALDRCNKRMQSALFHESWMSSYDSLALWVRASNAKSTNDWPKRVKWNQRFRVICLSFVCVLVAHWGFIGSSVGFVWVPRKWQNKQINNFMSFIFFLCSFDANNTIKCSLVQQLLPPTIF